MKAGCDWIHVAHATLARPDEVIAKIKARSGTAGSIIVKFEPFILHVQCRNLDAAKRIHTAAVEAGYRDGSFIKWPSYPLFFFRLNECFALHFLIGI